MLNKAAAGLTGMNAASVVKNAGTTCRVDRGHVLHDNSGGRLKAKALRITGSGFALCIALLLNGCATPWNVEKQTTPNPFVGKTSFSAAPLKFSADPDGLDAKQRASYEKDKEAMIRSHFGTLAGQGAANGLSITESGGDYVIHAEVVHLELGNFWIGRSEVTTVVELRDRNGNTLDRITVDRTESVDSADSSSGSGGFTVKTSGLMSGKKKQGMGETMDRLSSGTRIRSASEAIAKIIVEYLKTRTSDAG